MQSSQEIIQNKKTLLANSYKLKDLKANSYYKNISIEDKAVLLMETLKADTKWLRWYCGVLHKLPEGTISFILEGAKKADNPAHYFAKAASAELKKNFTN